MPKNGEIISGNSINYYPSGKGAKQAVGIAKMNYNVELLAACGKDKWANLCISSCNKFKIKKVLNYLQYFFLNCNPKCNTMLLVYRISKIIHFGQTKRPEPKYFGSGLFII